jgi:xanthine/uracil permease
LNQDALVAPKVNDLYTRKSRHIVDQIQRMQRINEIAILIGAPIAWALYAALGMPYGGAIMCTAWVGLIVVRRQFPHLTKFDAPVSVDSYQYLKAFQGWLKNRLTWGRRVQRHIYAATFIAFAIGLVESAVGQLLIRTIVENFPDVRLVNGVPLVLIAVVLAMTIVVDLFGGVIFDFDVKTAYRRVFEKLDQMVAEMEELRG